MTQFRDAASAFLAIDPDPQTRAELQALLNDKSEGAEAELKARFDGILKFGTAGIRGKMGAGTLRMNRLVVRRATWGFAKHLISVGEKEGFDAKQEGVVVAFDGRKNSRQFAEDTRGVLNALGIKVHMASAPIPTPVCAFAVDHLNAAGAVMVTASHNPPQDNGYKVYWRNGAQIIPPHDRLIAEFIDKAPGLPEVMGVFEASEECLLLPLEASVQDAYHKAVKARAHHKNVSSQSDVRIVYTAMHGVGHNDVMRALQNAGFHKTISVPAQADPDAAFSTVAFPNPEEEGALDLALALAKENKADLVLANDPDADRISVSLPSRDGKSYVSLSGNDVGALLGADALEYADTGDKKKIVITTIVSSTMLSRIAKNKGAIYRDTLTGFKWIANTALDLEAKGDAQFVFGFEEALGASVSNLVRDKDGVSAAVRVAELAAKLKSEGKTLHDRLDELAVANGLSVGAQWSVKREGAEGLAQIAAWMDMFRANPFTSIGGEKVERSVDLMAGKSETGFEKSNVLISYTDKQTRVIVRPSGTEPKIKFYIDAVDLSVADVGELSEAKVRLGKRLAAMREEISGMLG